MAIAGLGVVLALGVIISEACNPRSSAVAAGGECFLATDCAPGLVCIEQPNKTRVCSDDLTRVEGRGPPEAGPEGDGGEEEGGVENEGGQPVEDTGTPQQDTGTPQQDTGAPPQDSGGGGNGDD